jgi:polyisoprenoid-binding protein YceI
LQAGAGAWRPAVSQLAREAKEALVTRMTPGTAQARRAPQPATGSWWADPARSRASFIARIAGRAVRGSLPLTGHVVIAEPIEHSTALLAASAPEVSTGSPALDRLLAGPGFLDAGTFPEISFRSELLAWVPTGWRAVGRLQVKGAEYELACQLSLHRDDSPLDGPPRFWIVSSWVIDSGWVTRQWIPDLSRRIPMTCSFLLEPRDAGRLAAL